MISYYYLASPYSDPSQEVRERRYRAALQAVHYLTEQNLVVYSPIVHFHQLADEYGLPKHYRFWQRANKVMIKPCSMLVILALEGWEDSEGVMNERAYAQEIGKPIQLLKPTDL